MQKVVKNIMPKKTTK